MGLEWIDWPEIRYIFVSMVKPCRMYQESAPFDLPHRAATPTIAVVCNPSGYNFCTTPQRFGSPYRAFGKHRFAEQIAISHGMPLWGPSFCTLLARGPGETEIDLRDFIYFASPSHFSHWCLVMLCFVGIPYDASSCRSSIMRVGCAEIVDLSEFRWAVLLRGEPRIPEFPPGRLRRPLYTIGMKCREPGEVVLRSTI